MEGSLILWIFLSGAVVTIIIIVIGIYLSEETTPEFTPEKKAKEDARLKHLHACIDKYYNVLVAKCERLIYYDEYDQPVVDEWLREEKDFLMRVVFRGQEITKEDVDNFEDYFFEKYEKDEDQRLAAPMDGNTGEDFEAYIENCILAGTPDAEISRTPKNGDQGADLLVTLANNLTVAVQCKYYSSPVGNAAVQEAIAGKVFYKTNFAFVITNSTFTPSARQLAQMGDIQLIENVSTSGNVKINLSAV